MSNGDDEADPDAGDAGAGDEPDPAGGEADPDAADAGDATDAGGETAADAGESAELSTETVESRLDDAEEALEAAETEADLDAVEAELDEVESAIEGADLPEPDDEDEADPAADLESRLDGLREDLEDARGPYAEDVVAVLESAESTVADAEWTDDGEGDVRAAVEEAVAAAGEALDREFAVEDANLESLSVSVATVREAVAEADVDPDDAETIEALLGAAETLADDLEAAEVWSDLTIREQLATQGFYDVLTPENRKDFPPEWNAVKVYAEGGEAEPILTALDRYESDFMEENVLDALERFAPPAAVEPLVERAERRDKHAIRVLGRIGDERAREAIEDLLGGGDVGLDVVCLRALGAIGSTESTQAVADRLVADSPDVRSVAARSLGLIGDTRAIDPLADALDGDDADEVRASAAWALNQIGTEEALETAAEYADDRSYIVQAEAEKAAGA